jgi:hypothetical protein
MRLASRSSTRRLGIGWAWWVGREGRTVASVREREDMKGEEREHCGIEPAPALKRSRILWSRLLFAKLPDSLSLSLSFLPLRHSWPKSQQWAHPSLQGRRDGQEDAAPHLARPAPQSPQIPPAQSLLPASPSSTAPPPRSLLASVQSRKTSMNPQTNLTRTAPTAPPIPSPLFRMATGAPSGRAKRKKNQCSTLPLIQL